MNASHDQTDHVDRARLVDSCGARDDSPCWNLGRAKQDDTIRVDGSSPQSRGQQDVKESGSKCFRAQQAKPLSGMLSQLTQQLWESATRCKTKENDASVTRLPGNDESSKNNPISEEEQLIGRRFSVEEWRRSPSDDVAEMHKVTCESNWPDK